MEQKESAINGQKQDVELTAIPVTGALQVNFSKAVTKESVNVNNVRIYEVDGNVPVSIAASNINLSQDGLTATVNLNSAGLKKGKEYKVEVKNVKSTENKTVKDKTVNFKTSTASVVTNAYFENTTTDNDNNAPTGVDELNVVFDEKLSPSSVTTSNISLVDLSTGKKLPINLSVTGATGNTINVTTDSALVDGKQYKLSISGVKTATGEDAEAYTKSFAVNATTPLTTNPTVTTVDGTNALSNDVWPNLESGIEESGNTYHAGLKLNVGIAEKLDASSIEANVQLVEKVSKKVVPATITYNSDAKILTIVPKADLKQATDFEIQFKGGLKSVEGIYLDASKKTEVITTESLNFTTLDITDPTVVSVTAKNGSSDLKITETQEFTVKLSEPIAGLNNGNIVLAEAGIDFDDQTSITAKRIPASKVQVTAVPGQEATYSVKVAANSLTQNKAYKLVVVGKDLKDTALVKTSGNSVSVVADTAGNTLKTSSTSAFTTEGVDVTAPKVAKVYKGTELKASNEVTTATNVTASDSFTFEFDEKILDTAANIDSSKVKIEKYNGSTWVADRGLSVVTTAVQNTAGDKVGLTVGLSGVTVADAKYRIVLGEGTVQDVATNKNTQEKVFEFVGTAGDDQASNVQVATGTVAGTTLTPSTDPEAVAVGTKIYVGFDENEIFEVANSQVKVTDSKGNEVAGTFKESTDTLSGLKAGKQYIFTPEGDLKNGSVYTVTVEGVKDLAGNTIEKKVVSFKTATGATQVVESSVVDGATNVDRSKTITFKLSAADARLAADTTSADGKVVLKDSTGTAVPTGDYNLIPSKDNKEFKVVFNTALAANSKYSLEIDPTGDTDTNVETIEFTTGITATDDIKPVANTVNTVAITTGVIDITLGTQLDIAFSEDIDVSGATVAISNVSASPAEPIEATFAEGTAGTLEVTPFATLTEATTYKVVVTGIKDIHGNAADTLTIYVK